MKKLISSLLLLSFLFPEPHAWPALQGSDKQFSPAMSAGVMANPGFEFGATKWTASGGTLTTTTTAANIFAGAAAGSWDSSSASQTLLTTLTYTNGGGPTLTNQVAGCMVKCASGTCTHTFTVDDGSTALATAVTITSSTTGFVPVYVNYVAGTGGTVRPKFTSVASNEPILYIDGCWAGAAQVPGPNISQVNQNFLVGSAYIAATANCNPTRTSSTLGSFVDTDCPGATVDTNPGPGTIQTTDYDTIKFAVNSLPPGTYEVEMRFSTFISTSSQGCSFAINDGTTTTGTMVFNCISGVDIPIVVKGFYTYTTPANHTFEVYGSSVANALNIDNAAGGSLNSNSWFSIRRFPTASQTFFNPNLIPYPTYTTLTAGSGTYSLPSGVTSLEITACGPGGGGAGNTNPGNDGSAATSFGSTLFTCPAGLGGHVAGDAQAGVAACTVTAPAVQIWQVQGQPGHPIYCTSSGCGGGDGGYSFFGAAGPGGTNGLDNAQNANGWGSGGGGAQKAASSGGGGGGAGSCVQVKVVNPATSYSYAVGTGGSGGSGTSSGSSAANGIIVIKETYGLNTPVLIGGVQSPQNTTGATVINNWVTKSSGYTATALDETIEFTSSATLTLPAIASVLGKKYVVIANGAGVDVTIDPNASEKVCNQTTAHVIAASISGSMNAIEIQAGSAAWMGLHQGCQVNAYTQANISAGNCTSGTCGNLTHSGEISSVTYNGSTGSYLVNFVSGAFSSGPSCQPVGTRNANVVCVPNNANCTTSSCVMNCYTGNTGAGLNDNVSVQCTGYR